MESKVNYSENDNENKVKKFNKRAFISIAMFVSLIGLPYSGIMSHELQFEAMTQERHFWMSVHNMSALLFIIFAMFHFFYNWRSLLNYIKKGKIIISKEGILAIILVVFFVGIFSSHVFHVG